MAMFSFRESKHTNTLPSNLLRIYEPVESTNSLGDSFSGESLDLGSHHPPKLHRPLRTSVPPSDQATCFPSLITPVRFCSSHFSSCGLELQKKKKYDMKMVKICTRWVFFHCHKQQQKHIKIKNMCEIIRVIPVSNQAFQQSTACGIGTWWQDLICLWNPTRDPNLNEKLELLRSRSMMGKETPMTMLKF